jgi:hypothetical protein
LTLQPTPAGAATLCGPAWSTGAPLISLRPSACLRGATVVCILIAVAAVHACLASRFGLLQSAPVALATFLLLTWVALRHWRDEPGAIKIGPDGLVASNRAGEVIAHGHIAGCSQWSGWLLVLVLTGARNRSRPLLIAADSLSADAFRELAVLGRHAGRA